MAALKSHLPVAPVQLWLFPTLLCGHPAGALRQGYNSLQGRVVEYCSLCQQLEDDCIDPEEILPHEY